MKRASYREGIAWIAMNDDPDSSDAYDLEQLSGLISVLLLADLFGVDPEKVAKDVIKHRRKHLSD